ncbi:MAG: alpha/beta fold hydrolase [Paludibacteraceae bacterium]|nr:alpha/beta fold hydrolase [Paludibacteraceae bacterium]
MRFLLIIILAALLLLSAFFITKRYLLSAGNKAQIQNLPIQDELVIKSEEDQEKYISTISIDYLRSLKFDASAPEIVEELPAGSNYKRYIASYISDGYKIFGLLTVPEGEIPKGGYSAIVFNHGYIPPDQYKTTERYVAYVDYLASSGFVVYKIDLRGNGNSEGVSSGTYFSPGYTIDAINALTSLQKLDYVNAEKIGMWGHSMAGNMILRAMLVTDEIKAGVIWSGAVYSYEDFGKYKLQDNNYVRRQNPEPEREDYSAGRPGEERDARVTDSRLTGTENRNKTAEEIKRDQRSAQIAKELQNFRLHPDEVDYSLALWKSISLTQNLNFLDSPVQVHHAVNDPVVNIGYSRDLKAVMLEQNKDFELFEYEGGGHNIDSPYFEQAMKRTADFFKENL